MRNFPGQPGKDGAEAGRWYGAGHGWAIHRDQGAHGRFLDTGSRRYGRGTRVGAQGCHLLRCGGRGARASFLPGPEGSNGIVWPPRLRNMRRSDNKMNEPAQGSALALISVQRPMSDAGSSSPLDSSGYLRISPSKRRRNIWLLFAIPTTTTRPLTRLKKWSSCRFSVSRPTI